MFKISLVLFVLSFVSGVMGFIGVGYAASGVLGGIASLTLVLAVGALVGGAVATRTKHTED
jgi:uncharacterized membrane protein YtjA (UPF0391 family)